MQFCQIFSCATLPIEQGRNLGDNVTVHPQQRQERFDFLCREIDRLILRHTAMPMDSLKAIVGAQIEEHLREIETLRAELEQEQRVAVETTPAPSPPGYFSSGPGLYQAMGVGLLFALLGMIFGVYLMVFFGGIIVLVSITSWMRPTPPPPVAPPPVIDRKRWEWTP